MIELRGRVAFVTGGASGIGLGIARALLGAGVSVALADVDESRLETCLQDLSGGPGRVVGVRLDVRDRDNWSAAKAHVEREIGPVSLLFNNAGVTAYDPIVETPPELWDWVLAINTTGVFNGISAFGRDMVARGDGGHIVNTASSAGVYGSKNLTVGAYIASKYAVVGLSERLRTELAPFQIGVSVLCPGLVRTEIGANVRKLQPVAPGIPLADNPIFRALRETAPTAGMSPEKVGDFVIEAVRANRAYIFTHPEIRPFVEDRLEGLLADFGASADPDRVLQPGWEVSC